MKELTGENTILGDFYFVMGELTWINKDKSLKKNKLQFILTNKFNGS